MMGRAKAKEQRSKIKSFEFCFLGFALCSMYFRIPLVAAESLPAQQAATAWEHRDQPGKTEEAIHLWQEALKTAPERDTTCLDRFSQSRGSRGASQQRAWRASKVGGRSKIIGGKSDREKSAKRRSLCGLRRSAGTMGEHAQRRAQPRRREAGRGRRCKKSIALNPKYAYAHMLLAEFYRQSPRVISVGDKQKALEQARLAVEDGHCRNTPSTIWFWRRPIWIWGKKPEGVAELKKSSYLPRLPTPFQKRAPIKTLRAHF